MSNKLSLYADATKLSLENAEQWTKDAKLLLDHGSFGHASALIRLAVEEAVKAVVCWFTSEKIWPLENKIVGDVFRYHRVKNEFFLGFLSAWMARARFHSWRRLMESIPKLSQKEVFEALEGFEKMITSTMRMREKAMYVNVEGKEVETPLAIVEEEPKKILTVAESFVKTVRSITEKMPRAEKAKLKRLFSEIPKEDWKTGELTTDWLMEVMGKTP